MAVITSFLKTVFGTVLMPLNFFLILIIWFAWKKKLTAMYISIGLLFVISTPLVGSLFVKPFDFYAEKLDIEEIAKSANPPKYIWVLGCWHTNDDLMPIEGKLHQCSMTRIVQAVRFAKILPEAQLIFTGSPPRAGQPSNPAMGAKLASELGLSDQRMIVMDGTANTLEEIYLVKALAKDHQVIAVSSASHMKRLEFLSREQQLKVVLSPAEYLSGHGEFDLNTLLPSASGLKMVERGMYEMMGNIWYQLKSW